MSKRVLLQGNEAVVEGALAAGMRFFAGYPITPSTEIAEQASLRLPLCDGHFIQMEDEISSMAAVIGASAAGVKSMTATSGPGFSLKQENIGYACLSEIPCVIVDVQRSGPSTGLPTSPSQGDYMQARWGTHGDHPVIALSPSSVGECYTLTVRAFDLSEKYRTPVILLMDEIIGHLREGVELPGKITPAERPVYEDPECLRHPYHIPEGAWVPGMKPFGQGEFYNVTGLIHDEEGFPTNSNEAARRLVRRLLDKIEKNYDDIVTVEEFMTEDADTLIVCFGGTARAAKEAVLEARAAGVRAGLFRPVTVWPFPEKELFALSGRVKRILTVEHNDGQMAREVERAVRGRCETAFLGKIDGSVITPREILEAVKEGRRNGK
ncbi:MAG: 2-oxoacid:acceptor oxidoreductase subunit alpha [Clostridia bacterium]|nr:2-oxoacid:acceptor oxidoreductase subunit alpha [Clostridia bacterium]